MTYETYIYLKNILYGYRRLHPYGLRKRRKYSVSTGYPVGIDRSLCTESDG